MSVRVKQTPRHSSLIVQYCHDTDSGAAATHPSSSTRKATERFLATDNGYDARWGRLIFRGLLIPRFARVLVLQ